MRTREDETFVVPAIVEVVVARIAQMQGDAKLRSQARGRRAEWRVICDQKQGASTVLLRRECRARFVILGPQRIGDHHNIGSLEHLEVIQSAVGHHVIAIVTQQLGGWPGAA